ncbi:hypothetical protein PQR33_45560, partial [Paraburkholderia sediminicola]|uniref:hypothetical protein n=1 Tax=Paraburkholderia sediminicola TaxID=458836 RepID=UPI0038B6C352
LMIVDDQYAHSVVSQNSFGANCNDFADDATSVAITCFLLFRSNNTRNALTPRTLAAVPYRFVSRVAGFACGSTVRAQGNDRRDVKMAMTVAT